MGHEAQNLLQFEFSPTLFSKFECSFNRVQASQNYVLPTTLVEAQSSKMG